MSSNEALQQLLSALFPSSDGETYVFATVPADRAIDPAVVVASIREPEGVSVIVAEADAERLGLVPAARCVWITLGVQSALTAHGLTAAFARALADAAIACNVVAGVHHDHLFVPVAEAPRALAVLEALQHAAGAEPSVEAAEAALREAMLSGDVASLDRLLDDRLRFIGPDGAVYSKADDLALHRAGTTRFARIDVLERTLVAHDDVVIATVRTELGGTYQGSAFAGTFLYQRLWRQVDGAWRIIGGSVRALT